MIQLALNLFCLQLLQKRYILLVCKFDHDRRRGTVFMIMIKCITIMMLIKCIMYNITMLLQCIMYDNNNNKTYDV